MCDHRRARRAAKRRAGSSVCLEALEPRLCMSGDLVGAGALAWEAGAMAFYANLRQGEPDPALAAPVDPPTAPQAPVLHSLPGAPVRIFLDFDGDYTEQWGGAFPGLTPAFDADGDSTTFNDLELTAIERIWQRVSEMFSPFNIDVTTEAPPPEEVEQTVHVVIGGDGAWTGATFGGLAQLDSFWDPQRDNLCWVFIHAELILDDTPLTVTLDGVVAHHEPDDPVAITTDKTLAIVAAHEAGHVLGLAHQRTFGPDGGVTQEYNPGTLERGPIMGNAALSDRALWWIGPAISANQFQDDVAVLTRPINGFGYRPDEAGDSIGSAAFVGAALDLFAGVAVAQTQGVITTLGDVDVFAFNQAQAGHAVIRLDVAQRSAMLDAAVDVLDAQGQVIATADSATLGETFTVSLPAGSFYVAVRSHGQMGDIGQYTLTVRSDVQPPALAKVKAPRRTTRDLVKLSVRGAIDSDGQVQKVRLFLDSDANGKFDPNADLLLGEVEQFNRKGRGSIKVAAELFSIGRNTVFAVPRDDSDADGVAVPAVIGIQPHLRLQADPKVVSEGGAVRLTADNVLLLGTRVTEVRFYQDVNDNGQLDDLDVAVGVDRDGRDGWTTDVDLSGFAPGSNLTYLAIAQGANGDTQAPAFSSVSINGRPVVRGLTLQRDPHLPFVFEATVTGLDDADGAVQQVHLYLDSNANGRLDAEDELLVSTDQINGRSAVLRFTPPRALPGAYRVFAVAQDQLGGRSAPVSVVTQLGGG
jgi:hypothetical protein